MPYGITQCYLPPGRGDIPAQRVRFKLALIVFKCLHGLAPSYLTDDCVLVSSVAGRRPLRSADTRTLYVPRTRTAIGASNFAVAGPRVWNSLPPELRMLNCRLPSAPLRRN